MAAMELESAISTMERDHFVSPIRPPERVISLESCEPSQSTALTPCHDGYLGVWTLDRVPRIVTSFLLVAIQLHLTVVAFSVPAMHGKPVDTHLRKVENQLQFYVTIIPILFTAVMGRLFRAFALNRAERGITLGNLERFIGSQSLYTALRTQLTIMPLTFIGCFIILVWILSPFASQAALRISSVKFATSVKDSAVRYLDVVSAAQKNLFAVKQRRMGLQRWLLSFALFFNVAVLTQWTAHSPMDSKGYVKIPSVRSLVPGSGTWDPAEWRQVDKSQPVSYSSFYGIPVADLHDDTNTTFQLESRYWSINCSMLERGVMPYNDVVKATSWTGAYQLDLALPTNDTRSRSAWPMQFRSLRGDSRSIAFDADQLSSLKKGRDEWPALPINIGNCSIGAQDVVSNVSCVGKSCEVDTMRLLNEVQHLNISGEYPPVPNMLDDSHDQVPLASKNVWNPAYWDCDYFDKTTKDYFGMGLPIAGTPVMGLRMALNTLPLATTINEEHFSLLEGKHNITPVYARYMNGIGATAPELWLLREATGYLSNHYYPWPDSQGVNPVEFSSRLETLINTWWQSFYMPVYLQGNPMDAPVFDHENHLVLSFGYNSGQWNTTASVVSERGGPICNCHLTWVLVLIVTCAVMLIASFATLILDFVNIAPDIFGFASSFARDNVYMPEYVAGSYMSGAQRARALKDIKVRLGDVKLREPLGHISLTADLGAPSMLRRDRKYD